MPSPRTYLLALLAAAGLALLAYLLFPYLGLGALAARWSFALGVLGGGLLGALFFARRPVAQAAEPAATGESKTVFVGNLSFQTSAEALRALFSQYGDVHSVRLMTDRATRRPRGFGFVEMERRGAEAAIQALDGQEFGGRQLKVNEGRRRAARE